jgi:AraC-like DNA-binding protein
VGTCIGAALFADISIFDRVDNRILMLRRSITCILFLLFGLSAGAQVTFVIESLPNATPPTDTIFLCGSFNGWVTDDPTLALQRQLNGQLAITINLPAGKHEYKFTRGNWTKVETSKENTYIGNRVIEVDGSQPTVVVQIENWLDLGGARPLNYVIFYFFACAFQAIALCLLVYRIQKKDAIKFKSFLATNVVFVLLLILLVLLEIANQIWQTYFAFIFQVGMFCWGPLLIYFVRGFGEGKRVEKFSLYFIPAVLALLVIVVRLLNLRMFTFLSDVIWPPFTVANVFFLGLSFVYNLFIYGRLFRNLHFLSRHQNSDRDVSSSFIYYFYWISFTALLLIPLHVVLQLNGIHHPSVEDFHGSAIVLSSLIFLETYYLWKYPEMLREEKTPVVPLDYSPDLVEKLNVLMLEIKPYKKADLTVSDLAELLGTRSHILSRVINDNFDKNFRDFVNTYRIEEFIALANTKEYKHYTFLALAQEVGFNSKSTFNLAFKKLMNQSPREYFKSRGVTDEE